MKESFEEKMASKFREVLEDYQAPYNPQAWEQFQTKLPLTENLSGQRKRWNWKGSSLLFISAIAILTLFYYSERHIAPKNNQSIQSIEKMKEELQPNLPADSSFFSETTTHIFKQLQAIDPPICKKANCSREPEHSYTHNVPNLISKEKIASIRCIRKEIANSESVNDGLKFASKSFLVSVKNKKIDPTRRKSTFKWPKLQFPPMSGNMYSDFVGPNKISIFYNPEIHHSYQTKGLSQGISIEIEGPINDFLSIVGGVNFQNFTDKKQVSASNLVVKDKTDQTIRNLSTKQLTDTLFSKSTNYQFLEIPFCLNMHLISTSPVSIIFQAGISGIVFLDEKYTFPYRDLQNEFYEETSTFNRFKNKHILGSIQAGVAFRYQLSQRISFQAGIKYKHPLTELGGNRLQIKRFNTQAGLVYRFGKNQ